MADNFVQKETPAPVTVAKGGRGSSEVNIVNMASKLWKVKQYPFLCGLPIE